MKKYILFNLREDEKAIAERFVAEHPELALELHTEALSAKTMDLVKPEHDAVIVSQVAPIADEVYDHLGACGIKVFSVRSAGYDNYNLKKLKEHGIRLTNVASYSPESIAEFAYTLGLFGLRRVRSFSSASRSGDFRWNPALMTRRIKDCTVGILGTGRIGQQTARLFKALGARVLGYDIYPNQRLVDEGLLSYAPLDEVLSRSDLISLHMPAFKENYHLLDACAFAKAKPGQVLVNTARGSLLDTEALLDALDKGQLSFAALDTYEHEAAYLGRIEKQASEADPTLERLLSNPRVLYTPHIAFYTHEAIQALFCTAVEAAAELLETSQSSCEVVL